MEREGESWKPPATTATTTTVTSICPNCSKCRTFLRLPGSSEAETGRGGLRLLYLTSLLACGLSSLALYRSYHSPVPPQNTNINNDWIR